MKSPPLFQLARANKGLTLVELLITLAILGIGIMGSVSAFKYITISVQHSKARTLTTNLAQEQIEKLKNLSYYTLLITTSTYADSRCGTTLYYDTGNYPAASITEGGMRFIRASRVDFAYQTGTTVSTVPWTNDDTALKKITVYVMWQEGQDWKYQEMQNLMANPASPASNATISGWVRTPSSVAIPGALVQVVDNAQWYTFSDNSGNYRFSVTPGSYTLQASSVGYFTATTNGYQSVTSGSPLTYNFTMTQRSSGTATGYVYLANHLLVSEVATSTGTSGSVEYVELYNPTPSGIAMGSGASAALNFYIFDHDDVTQPTSGLQPVPLVYVSTYVPAFKYYLIANSSAAIQAGGVSRTPDAYYNGYLGTHLFDVGDAGGTGVTDLSGHPIDSVSWSKTSGGHICPSTPMEGSCVSLSGGLGANEVLMRLTDPGAINTSYGRSYDSDDNNSNFVVITPIPTGPNSTSQGTVSPRTGTPATGAIVNINDPLSNTSSCNSTTVSIGYCPVGGCRVCSFTVPGIATGTWTMDISSATSSSTALFSQIQNVTVTANVSTGVPNGGTTPAWTTVGSTVTLLLYTTDYAFVSGTIYNGAGAALGGIKITDGNGHSAFSTSGTGKYMLLSATGTVQVSANPADSSQNRAYVTDSQDPGSPLSSGQLYDNINFYLPLGGVLRGYFKTTSNTALPGRAAEAIDMSGNPVAQAASDSSGRFYLQNLSTGTYVVQASLDPAEVASPSSATVVLTSTGASVSVTTFTISNGLSDITGQVTLSSVPITTGVLVLASTTTLSGGASSLPPAITGGSSVLCNPCYYAGSSDSTGSYTLSVRSSATSYKLYGWYTTISGTTASTTRSGPYTVNVSTGGQIISQNLIW